MKNSEESLNSTENQNDTQVSQDSNVSNDPDFCEVCGAVAQVGVIGLRTHNSYCNKCYNAKYKRFGRKTL